MDPYLRFGAPAGGRSIYSRWYVAAKGDSLQKKRAAIVARYAPPMPVHYSPVRFQPQSGVRRGVHFCFGADFRPPASMLRVGAKNRTLSVQSLGQRGALAQVRPKLKYKNKPNLKKYLTSLDRWEKVRYNVVDCGSKWVKVVIEHLFCTPKWGTFTHHCYWHIWHINYVFRCI